MSTVDRVKSGRRIRIKSYEETGAVLPAGKVFVEWSTEPDGCGIHYRPGQTVPVYVSIRLYPVFKDAEAEAAE